MTSESSDSDQQLSEIRSSSCRRVQNNQIMLDLRHQVQNQERVIRNLIVERDGLTRELDSRLFLVEAQLRREQKHIESVLNEKEQLIEFQAREIHSLKQLLSQVSENQNYYQRSNRSSKRSLSKRYSVALDEYMKDHCIVSRALPVIVHGENEMQSSKYMRRNRARSLPELRFKEEAENQMCCDDLIQNHLMHGTNSPHQRWCHSSPNAVSNHLPFVMNNAKSQVCSRPLQHDILDDISNRRWASDCDSEHSDSLDSGISSPSIKSRNMHENFLHQDPFMESEKKANSPYDIFEPEYRSHEIRDSGPQKPRRSSSIGNFINRTFSSSSSSEKTKDNQEVTARRHSSFSGAENKNMELESPVQKTRFINSTNRTFGTNHRSVTKPRDIKFKKLFKFRRRTEPDPVTEDYMTV